MTAISAVSRNVKTMSDGTLRLTIDIEPSSAQDAFMLFGMPDVPMAIARLTQQSSQAAAQEETIANDEMVGGFISKWCAMRNQEPQFWEFMTMAAYKKLSNINSAEACDKALKALLEISSKKELDNDPAAAQRYHTRVRLPYQKWLAGAR